MIDLKIRNGSSILSYFARSLQKYLSLKFMLKVRLRQEFFKTISSLATCLLRLSRVIMIHKINKLQPVYHASCKQYLINFMLKATTTMYFVLVDATVQNGNA